MLLAVGLLLQLQLGLAASDSAGLRYYERSSALLALGAGASVWARALWRARPPLPRVAEPVLAALAALALAALLLQVLWGDETGVFGLQPVEFAKLALCALAAHCLALAQARQPASGWRRLLPYAAPVAVCAALVALALVEVDDFSPLVLLALWAGGLLLAWLLAQGRRRAVAAVLLLVLGAGAALGALKADGQWFGQLRFYGARFQLWLAPAAHPHTGRQLLLAGQALAAGGWFGHDGRLGLTALAAPAPQALAIPAVQDDFAPSFLIHRHGLLAALLLWGAQAALLAALAGASLAAQARARVASAHAARWRAHFLGFALAGGAAFLGGHFLLSWGTNLAILPIMGQPMSALSAGGSHLLFFLLPLLGLAAITCEET
ncbi:FtsW/RodA/SpoVE family cell cycle protein [Massilia sp. TS11]|nr:FtsW/RodA/SpoVE family cell cycle protein [Massilia sp. TS11]